MPQAWGPFRNPGLATLTRRIIDGAALAFARDRQSLGFLRGLGPSTAEKVQLAPDVVFRLSPFSAEVGRAILARHGLSETDQPIIAIAPNMRVYERAQGVGYLNGYVQLLIEIARFCLVDLQASVALIPHERADPSKVKQDDQFLCGLVKSALTEFPRCVSISVPDDPRESMSILSNCAMVVGSRFHVLVLGLTAGVPVVSLGWSHKYDELLEDFGLGGFVIKEQARTPARIAEVIKAAWSARAASRHIIAAELQNTREKLDSIFDQVANEIVVVGTAAGRSSTAVTVGVDHG